MNLTAEYFLDSIGSALPESPELRLQLGALIMGRAHAELDRQLAERVDEIRSATLTGDDVLTVSDAAELLSVSEGWIRERVNRKLRPIPAIRDGVIRIQRRDLSEWIEAEKSHGKTKLELLPQPAQGQPIPIRRKRVG